MRSKLASWLRRLAERVSPTPASSPVDALMPRAREVVRQLEAKTCGGSIKWLLALKTLERETRAKRRHINAAIDRAVLEIHGD